MTWCKTRTISLKHKKNQILTNMFVFRTRSNRSDHIIIPKNTYFDHLHIKVSTFLIKVIQSKTKMDEYSAIHEISILIHVNEDNITHTCRNTCTIF